MVDKDLILAKAGSAKKHIKRIQSKSNTDMDTFLSDIDRQESILFNIQMAIQNCIDIAAHIVSDESLGAPGSTNEMFYMLEDNGYIGRELTEKMVRAIGFRNLIVHEYAKLELKQVFKIAGDDIRDLNEYLKMILKKLGLSN
ncbi:conserved hypothetical protein [uncultured Desulfobacterium sp.]|uniref:DUF86 domain-containing protein n=1 Tax=uncultured Desulfobacterium sp. TaxID=201089 RepID=A0A445MXV4_9BACT|nr:conserved hypothetical protein [uncultured Desulfobacterium sp.]